MREAVIKSYVSTVCADILPSLWASGVDDLSDDEHKATEDLLVDCGSYLFFLSRVRVRTLF